MYPQSSIDAGEDDVPACQDLRNVTLPKVLEMPSAELRETWRLP